MAGEQSPQPREDEPEIKLEPRVEPPDNAGDSPEAIAALYRLAVEREEKLKAKGALRQAPDNQEIGPDIYH